MRSNLRTSSRCVLAAVVLLAAVGRGPAQEPPLPPADRTPVLRVDPGGPAAPVPAVAVAPDGDTIYVAGLDKLVRVYSRKDGKFVEGSPLRVPLGPGNAGAVNAVAVSPDGRWVAAAGRAPMRDEAKFADDGLVTDARRIPPPMRRDLGVIYVWDRTNPNGGKLLRGNRGEVRAVAFANPSPATGPVLVSAATEFDAADRRAGVVRVWDVAKAAEIAVRDGFPGSPTKPGLAAWPVGESVRVAVSWSQPDPKDDGELVVWNAGKKAADTHPAGGYNLGVAVRGGKDLISTDFRTSDGRSVGRITVRSPERADNPRTLRFPYDGKRLYRPLAVAPVGDGFAVLFETAVPEPDDPRPGFLQRLAADGKLLGEARIAKLATDYLPTLAASADGQTLAVAGFDDHRIEVYAADKLAAGPTHTLPGAAGGFRRVVFLPDGKLWLRARGDDLDGGIDFDTVERKILAHDPKAKPDVLSGPTNYDLDRTPGSKANEWTLSAAKDTLARVTLRKLERPTAVAYIPAGPAWNKALPALVAVAHTNPDDRVTLVTLFDAKSGKPLRQLAGPEQPVRWLAVAGSRPLLTAVGDDPTVSVWSLKDLDKQVGAITGVELIDRGEGPVVAAVEPGVKGLKPGDRLDGVGGEKGDLTAVKSLPELLWNVRARAVGSTVGVRVAGNPGRVLLPVGRGVEQRNPLFTLWIGPGAKPTERAWVGWSPHGPYDASSPAAEARIGWVTMTGDPAAHVTFAGAGQYRKTYYRKDVLRFLAEKGDLSAAIDAHTDAYPPPTPNLRVRLEGEVPQPAGLPLVRGKSAALAVNLSDVTDDFPLDRAVLRWRVTGPGGKPGPWADVPLAGRDRTFAVDLADYPWVRGRHTFEATLHRTPASPPATASVAEVRFAPPAPVVTALVGGKPAGATFATEAATVAVSAAVEPGGGPADVILTWTGPGGETGSAPVGDKPVDVPLKPGVTAVRLTATTRGAGESAPFESHAVEVRVTSTPPKVVLPPRIARFEVSVPTESQEVNDRTVFVTDVPKFAVAADLDSDEPLAEIAWDDGDGTFRADAVPANAKSATARRELTLEPGKPRAVRVRAKAAKSPVAEREIVVAYHPPLPAVSVAPLAATSAGVTARTFPLRGDFRPATDAADTPFRVRVVVGSAGGKVRFVDAVADVSARTWSADVPLDPGANHFGLEVRNDWRTDTFPNLATVAYRRPPRVFSVRPADAGETAAADVTATVVTDPDVPPTAALVNGRPADAPPARRLGSLFGRTFWRVTVPGVPVKSGETWAESVKFAARNADGDSPPVAVPVTRVAKVIPPPVVALADGAKDRTTDKPDLPVKFRVASASKLTRVEVWHAGPGGDLDRVAAADPATFAAGPDGFTAVGDVSVPLLAGVNRVRVVAVGGGGEAVAEFAAAYTPPAFQVLVDAVEELLPAGGVSPPVARTGDEFAAKSGIVTVRGRIRWAADDAPLARDPKLSAVLVVNEVEHLPVQLDPQAGRERERTFRVPVFLNAKLSRLRFEFRTPARDAAAPQQSVGAAAVRVRCDNPLTEQRMHLVVVGVDVPAADRGALARRVVRSIGGVVPKDREAGFDRGEFAHAAFAKAVLYPPVVGEVDDGKVAWVLDEVGRELKRLGTAKPGGWLNDVILLYYQGSDWVDADGRRWLHTSRSRRYAKSAASRFAIRVDGLPTTPGVRLVVLNVVEPSKEKPDAEPDAIAGGPPLIRYAFRTPAATADLLPAMQAAAAENRTLGGFADGVKAATATNPQRSGPPVEDLKPAIRQRPFGTGEK